MLNKIIFLAFMEPFNENKTGDIYLFSDIFNIFIVLTKNIDLQIKLFILLLFQLIHKSKWAFPTFL